MTADPNPPRASDFEDYTISRSDNFLGALGQRVEPLAIIGSLLRELQQLQLAVIIPFLTGVFV
jgi:hypothetical protein